MKIGEIRRLRRAGYTFREIGNLAGMSHQRVWQLLNPDKSKEAQRRFWKNPKNRERLTEYHRKWRRTKKEFYLDRSELQAIVLGLLKIIQDQDIPSDWRVTAEKLSRRMEIAREQLANEEDK